VSVGRVVAIVAVETRLVVGLGEGVVLKLRTVGLVLLVGVGLDVGLSL